MNLFSKKNWKTVRLGDVATITHGYAFKGEYFSDVPTNKILLTPGNFAIGGGWKNGKKFYNDLGETPQEYILKAEDLIVSMTDLSKESDTLGYSALIPDEPSKIFLHNQRVGLVKNNDSVIDKIFLYYLLRSYPYQRYIVNTATGSTVKHTSPTKILEYEFPLPSLNEQKEIAAMLGSFDDKIELLRRENKTLESIAQTLFKEWFVDFKFPGYEKIQFVDGLLEGWRVGKLGDVFKLPSGFAFKSATFFKDGKYRLVTITNVKNGYFESKTAEGINELPKNMPNYCRIGTGDILLSLTGEVGRVCIVVGENYILNQRVSKIEPLHPRDKAFVYFLMRSKEAFDQMQSIAVGAVQQNLSPVKTLDIEMIIPSEKPLQLFFETVSPIFNKLILNIQEIQTLSKLRDDLLNKIFAV